MLNNTIRKRQLAKLISNLTNILDRKDITEEEKTRLLYSEIGRFKEEIEIINIIPDLTVYKTDLITPEYFNTLYKNIQDTLYDLSTQLDELTNNVNERLEQEATIQTSLINMEDVINTKINEINNQIKVKVNKNSVNREEVISIDFRKNIDNNTLDIINSSLILHRTETNRLNNPDILSIYELPSPDYNNDKGIFNGKIIVNYNYDNMYINKKDILMDNDLNTEYIIQSTYGENPKLDLSINTNDDKFNMIYVLTNGHVNIVNNDGIINSIDNIFVFKQPYTTSIINITGDNKKKNIIVPKAILLDKITNNVIREFTYFKSLKILNNKIYNQLFGNEEIFDEDINISELNKIGIITQTTNIIPVSELYIKDIYIENNKYNNSGEWVSDIINASGNIISLDITADIIEYDTTNIDLYIQLPEIDKIGWFKINLYNKELNEDIKIPNRLVFKPDYVSKKDGDVVIEKDVTYFKIKVVMESKNEYTTPIISNINIRLKIME